MRKDAWGTSGIEDWTDMQNGGGHCEEEKSPSPAVIFRPLTAEAQFRSQASPRGIRDGQSGTGNVFSPSTLVFPCHCLLDKYSVFICY